MFPAFIQHPKNYRFEGQDTDENILLLLRAHPITNLQWIIPAVLLFIAPFFIPKTLSLLNINLDWLPPSYQVISLIINYLVVLVITFEGFLYWYFNVYIITDKNIVDIDFHSILFKNIDMAPLRNVEDVSSSMGGISNAIFHYGNVFIQTAGASRNIDFHAVPNPHHVADYVLDLSHKIHGKGGVHANQHPN